MTPLSLKVSILCIFLISKSIIPNNNNCPVYVVHGYNNNNNNNKRIQQQQQRIRYFGISDPTTASAGFISKKKTSPSLLSKSNNKFIKSLQQKQVQQQQQQQLEEYKQQLQTKINNDDLLDAKNRANHNSGRNDNDSIPDVATSSNTDTNFNNRSPKNYNVVTSSSSYYKDNNDTMLKEVISSVFGGTLLGMITGSTLFVQNSEFILSFLKELQPEQEDMIRNMIVPTTLIVGSTIGGMVTYKSMVTSTSPTGTNNNASSDSILPRERNYYSRKVLSTVTIQLSQFITNIVLSQKVKSSENSFERNQSDPAVQNNNNEKQNSSNSNTILISLQKNIINTIQNLPDRLLDELEKKSDELFKDYDNDNYVVKSTLPATTNTPAATITPKNDNNSSNKVKQRQQDTTTTRITATARATTTAHHVSIKNNKSTITNNNNNDSNILFQTIQKLPDQLLDLLVEGTDKLFDLEDKKLPVEKGRISNNNKNEIQTKKEKISMNFISKIQNIPNQLLDSLVIMTDELFTPLPDQEEDDDTELQRQKNYILSIQQQKLKTVPNSNSNKNPMFQFAKNQIFLSTTNNQKKANTNYVDDKSSTSVTQHTPMAAKTTTGNDRNNNNIFPFSSVGWFQKKKTINNINVKDTSNYDINHLDNLNNNDNNVLEQFYKKMVSFSSISKVKTSNEMETTLIKSARRQQRQQPKLSNQNDKKKRNEVDNIRNRLESLLPFKPSIILKNGTVSNIQPMKKQIQKEDGSSDNNDTKKKKREIGSILNQLESLLSSQPSFILENGTTNNKKTMKKEIEKKGGEKMKQQQKQNVFSLYNTGSLNKTMAY